MRHPYRELDHFTIDITRHSPPKITTLQSDRNEALEISWIKGHSGNKLHESADRHAAGIAFRPN
jgi:hypothetical protein